jgi:peroxiredoxin
MPDVPTELFRNPAMYRSFVILFFILGATSLNAADPQAASALAPANVRVPGHSMHGEAFDEGPRQAAKLLGSTGRVTFPITTKVTLAQQFFNQGIGQLHGFWYFEAERSFRQVAKLDPDCAMSYFGMALANVNNGSRAKGFLAEAVKRKGQASERERQYISALEEWYKADVGDHQKRKTRARNYINALEGILYQFPDDLEVKAMLGLALWQLKGDLEATGLYANDALLNDVLTVNPFHPVHHYRIHLWDNDKSTMAVNSAERCGLSAPGIAHMWHMSGHIYSDLHQYFDAVWHQEASARTDHAYMMRDGIFPDKIHNFAHNNEWLVRNLQYLGRIHDAIAIAKNTIDLPRHPKYNSLPGEKSAHYGRARLFQIYSQFELWDQLIAEAQTQVLAPTSDSVEQIKYFRHLGRACFRVGDRDVGLAHLTRLEGRLARLKQESASAVEDAIAKPRFDGEDAKSIEAKRNQASQPFAERIQLLEHAVDELKGHVLLGENKPVEALERFTKANDVDKAFLAEVEIQAGRHEAAAKRIRDWIGESKNQTRPLAALVEILWKQGKKDECKQSFESLRDISGSIDLDIPPYARLSRVAAEFGLPADWRKPVPVARNASELPDLNTLGPLFWQPVEAPEWKLPDADAQPHQLADYKGRPVLLVFYLGYGCLHCAEQLQAIAQKQTEFAKRGIALVAISSDSIPALKKSLDRYKSEPSLPFQLVSDSSFDIFKKYHAYDDFESSPLHASILIDAAGKIRWTDVGPDPFMNIDFVLGEADRLFNPKHMEMPQEPSPVEPVTPVDALLPRNVFPPANPAPTKPSDRREVAAGKSS